MAEGGSVLPDLFQASGADQSVLFGCLKPLLAACARRWVQKAVQAGNQATEHDL